MGARMTKMMAPKAYAERI